MTGLSFEQARHLVSRTGLGAELDTIQQLVGLPRQQVIESLLEAPRNHLSPQPRLYDFHQLRNMRRGDEKNSRQRANKLFRQDVQKVKHWAIQQALESPNPLQEKMTWFWHNHFTSSSQRSGRTARLLMRQSLLIRQEALGNFATLLSAMAYDPLMLIYLDGINNRRRKPNENFARELLELFTLGEGHYTEQDVKEVARSFTGLRFNNTTQRVVLQSKQFDDKTKTVFGKKGAFNGDDIIRLLLDHPRTAEFIVEKMWFEFISIDKPDPTTIKRWADTFRSANYNITTLLEAVLTDDIFWNPNNQGKLIKSPLELIIGTLRTLDLEDSQLPLPALSRQLKNMGQDLYTPPNVKGWVGGITWIDDASLPLRQQFLRRLTRGSNNKIGKRNKESTQMQMVGQDMPDMTDSVNKNIDTNMQMKKRSSQKMKQNNINMMRLTDLPDLPPEQWESWLLPVKAVTKVKFSDERARLKAILLDPAYQLK